MQSLCCKQVNSQTTDTPRNLEPQWIEADSISPTDRSIKILPLQPSAETQLPSEHGMQLLPSQPRLWPV